MNKLHFEGPINSLSLGNVSFNFLRELWRRKVDTVIFPTGNNANFEAYDKVDPQLIEWIKQNGFSRLRRIDKDAPTLRNWHINGSESRVAPEQFLYTYYETDSPTEEEVAIVNSQEHVFFSSSFAAECFKKAGCNNVSFVPLGFDEDFHITGRKFSDDVIHFGLIGKFERRKNTRQIIQTWLKKYGNNNKYLLTCLVSNPFFKPEDYQKIISDTLGGKTWSNINFLPQLSKNSEVNELMNAIDIDLSGMNFNEGWGLPAFNSACFGNVCVVGMGGAHLDWANGENIIQMKSDAVNEIYDNFFFVKGKPFNQGSLLLANSENMLECMELAESKILTNKQKYDRSDLKEKFSYSKSIDKILSQMDFVV